MSLILALPHCLRSLEAGAEESDALLDSVLASVNGIAAGMKTTG